MGNVARRVLGRTQRGRQYTPSPYVRNVTPEQVAEEQTKTQMLQENLNKLASEFELSEKAKNVQPSIEHQIKIGQFVPEFDSKFHVEDTNIESPIIRNRKNLPTERRRIVEISRQDDTPSPGRLKGELVFQLLSEYENAIEKKISDKAIFNELSVKFGVQEKDVEDLVKHFVNPTWISDESGTKFGYDGKKQKPLS